MTTFLFGVFTGIAIQGLACMFTITRHGRKQNR